MDKFLYEDNEPGILIQSKAAELYNRFNQLNIDALGLPEYCLHYFKSSHSKRLFFSIETSAHLLYNSIILVGKQPQDLVIMDYGAGVGTLYLLAKMIGCKQLIYNDHLNDWRLSAELIANAVGVPIDQYIVGDIDDCLNRLDELNIKCDIITSRNVIEHIYKLDEFYSAIHRKQPAALVYSSTTANKKNPAAAVKHILWHRKWEVIYRDKRMRIIMQKAPDLSADKAGKLARATKGLANRDLDYAIDEYLLSGKLPDPAIHHSNTCDPETGVWAEHLLSLDAYRRLINEGFFTVSFAPGFWDTHYSKPYKNKSAAVLNNIIRTGGKSAISLAPFIYVVAQPGLTK